MGVQVKSKEGERRSSEMAKLEQRSQIGRTRRSINNAGR